MSVTGYAPESQRDKTCCVAGHRDIPADMLDHARRELRKEIEAAIEDGYLYFLTDLMEGVDQLFAEAVVEMQKANSAIVLSALLPHRHRRDELLDDAKTFALLAACRDVDFACDKRVRNSVSICRRKMLQQSSRMIVVYDGRDMGGTVSAIRMANMQGVPIRELPLGL